MTWKTKEVGDFLCWNLSNMNDKDNFYYAYSMTVVSVGQRNSLRAIVLLFLYCSLKERDKVSDTEKDLRGLESGTGWIIVNCIFAYKTGIGLENCLETCKIAYVAIANILSACNATMRRGTAKEIDMAKDGRKMN